MTPGLVLNHLPNGMTLVSGFCRVTGQLYEITVMTSQMDTYLQGALVQDAFPNLGADQREFIMSRTSPKGWSLMFGED